MSLIHSKIDDNNNKEIGFTVFLENCLEIDRIKYYSSDEYKEELEEINREQRTKYNHQD